MLDRTEGDGVRVVLVEDATRFARSLMAQELGELVMQQRVVQAICSNGDNLTRSDDPSRTMMRQAAGAFAKYEKSRLVQKLRHTRDRKSGVVGRRIEGRKGYGSLNPEVVAEARRQRERRGEKETPAERRAFDCLNHAHGIERGWRFRQTDDACVNESV